MTEEINNNPDKNFSSDEIISFCRLLSAAVKSKLPLAVALLKYKDNKAKSKVAALADEIAEKLKNGYTVEEATLSLKQVDPVLARLVPLVGKEKLIDVFDIYTKYLIRREMGLKQARFLIYYPLVIMLFCIGIIVFLNIKIFPGIVPLAGQLSFLENMCIHTLYLGNFAYWPLSLIIPAILIYLFLDCCYILFTGKFTRISLWGRLTGLSKAIRLSEKARLAAMLSLYLKAGYTLEKAVEESSAFFEPVSKEDLASMQSRISAGNSLSDSLNTSVMLAEILNGQESFAEMPEKLNYMFNGLNSEAMMILNDVSEKLFYMSLGTAGFMVLAVSAGFFGSYSAIARSLV